MIKVDKDIPIPKYWQRTMYPFANMKVGDSFFVPNMKKINGSTMSRKVTMAAYVYGWRHEMKFITRTVTEEGIVGIRVWRIK